MTFASNHWQTQPVSHTAYVQIESQLVPTIAFERLPWLLPALQQLDALQRSGRSIPGLGDLRISEETSAVMRRLLSFVTNQYLPVPQLAPISGGGIAVSWNLSNAEVSFKVFPGVKEVVYVVSDERDETIRDGEFVVGQIEQMGAALAYLAGR